MDNVNRASCLSIFHLANEAPVDKIKSLDDEERQVVFAIADSIFSDQDFPSIENKGKIIERIRKKLTNETVSLKTTSMLESIGNFFKHHLLKTRPSSTDVQRKLAEATGRIKVHKDRSQLIERQVERAINDVNARNDKVNAQNLRLSVYENLSKAYSEFINTRSTTPQGGRIEQLKGIRDSVVRKLSEMRDQLSEEHTQITERAAPYEQEIKTRIEEDLNKLEERIKYIKQIPLETDFHKKLEEVSTYFAQRLEGEKNECARFKKELNQAESELVNLLNTQKDVDRALHYQYETFQKDVEEEITTLQNKIEGFAKDIVFSDEEIDTDDAFKEIEEESLNIENFEKIKEGDLVIKRGSLTPEDVEKSRKFDHLSDLIKKKSELESISKYVFGKFSQLEPVVQEEPYFFPPGDTEITITDRYSLKRREDKDKEKSELLDRSLSDIDDEYLEFNENYIKECHVSIPQEFSIIKNAFKKFTNTLSDNLNDQKVKKACEQFLETVQGQLEGEEFNTIKNNFLQLISKKLSEERNIGSFEGNDTETEKITLLQDIYGFVGKLKY